MRFIHILRWLLVSSCTCLALTPIYLARAQITPDNTLGTEGSIVTPDTVKGIPSDGIGGGAIRGSNLFHSFREFNIESGRGAYFSNANGVENILTRVTGNNASNIQGTLGVLGNANLFFMNPNGIIFGQNSRLDINGSFIASTASRIKFTDGTQFSSKIAESTPFLTVSVPLGLQYGSNPGSIQVKGDGQGFNINSAGGLQVKPNQTLALIGGDISLEGATLKTNGGSLELGSVAAEGVVSINPTTSGFSLGYEDVPNFGNIELTGETNVETTGIRAGGIQVQARNLLLSNNSRIASFNLGPLPGEQININTTESVEINGTGGFELAFASILNQTANLSERRNGLYVASAGAGSGGDVKINTQTLRLKNAGFILVTTVGQARGGNVDVNARETIEVIDSLLATGTLRGSTGDAGYIAINTKNLILQNRGIVGTNTFGSGRAGNLTVNASELIEMTGGETFTQLVIGGGINTRLSSDTFGNGNAGDLEVNTKNLIIQNLAQLSSASFAAGKGGNLTVNASFIKVIAPINPRTNNNQLATGLLVSSFPGSTGDAGNLVINADSVFIKNGDVQAETTGSGNGGNITVNASSLLLENGVTSSATYGSGNGGNITVNARQEIKLMSTSNNSFPGGLFTSADSIGAAGNVTINTSFLQMSDGASISVRNVGEGTAGNLNVNAHSIRLDNKAFIRADTRSNSTDPNQQQANITLRSQDLIMRRGSNITTNATGNNVIGGNININTDFLVAAENSDISANSTDFRGGQVNINALGIFGTQLRNATTPNSDITATGASPELSGTVEISRPDVDPSKGLVELSSNLVDASGQIDNSCKPGSQQQASSFTITGRGGLPSNPYESLQADSIIKRWVTVDDDKNISSTNINRVSNHSPESIVEAQGWIRGENGDIYLVTEAPKVTPTSSMLTTVACSSS